MSGDGSLSYMNREMFQKGKQEELNGPPESRFPWKEGGSKYSRGLAVSCGGFSFVLFYYHVEGMESLIV